MWYGYHNDQKGIIPNIGWRKLGKFSQLRDLLKNMFHFQHSDSPKYVWSFNLDRDQHLEICRVVSNLSVSDSGKFSSNWEEMSKTAQQTENLKGWKSVLTRQIQPRRRTSEFGSSFLLSASHTEKKSLWPLNNSIRCG